MNKLLYIVLGCAVVFPSFTAGAETKQQRQEVQQAQPRFQDSSQDRIEVSDSNLEDKEQAKHHKHKHKNKHKHYDRHHRHHHDRYYNDDYYDGPGVTIRLP
jgi:hypothetical protein